MRHFDGIESRTDCRFAAAMSCHDSMVVQKDRYSAGVECDLEEKPNVSKTGHLHLFDLRLEQSLAGGGLYALIDVVRGLR